jgi:hypothetical protein
MQRQAPTRSLLELPQSCLLTCLGLLDKRDKLALASTCRDVCAAVMRALPKCRLVMKVGDEWVHEMLKNYWYVGIGATPPPHSTQ